MDVAEATGAKKFAPPTARGVARESLVTLFDHHQCPR